MRREMIDIFGKLIELVEIDNSDVNTLSGSYREGFRLEGYDLDLIFWSKQHRVFWDVSHIQYKHSSKLTYVLADCSESPPGFALLQLPTQTNDETILDACVGISDKIYISSSIYKEMKCSAYGRDFKVHGPCVRGMCERDTELDAVHCFASNIWPPIASSWVERCQFWPASHIVKDIVKGGCHFVAIGHKLGKRMDNEWRISFSLAEQKLVYSMNHYQFLTYGLLKIFLKEVINNGPDENKLLCSYHMKTAIFWAIQYNIIPCLCSQNFVEGFLICFKLILKWVYDGSCPNFFIPENNMFLAHIFGSAQDKLFSRLHALYEKGLSSVLESTTIRSSIFNFFDYISPEICTDENTLVSECDFKTELFREVGSYDLILKSKLSYCVTFLHSIEQLLGLSLNQYQVLMLQRVTVSTLENTAFILHNENGDFIAQYLSSDRDRKFNKLVYVLDKMSFNMLQFSSRFGCISDMLYAVMYYYKTCRYPEALSLLTLTRTKLAKAYVALDLDDTGEHSWTIKIRELLISYVRLYNDILYIRELMIEQYYSLLNNQQDIRIPSLVLLYLLEFLCYKHVNTLASEKALIDLQDLVLQDQRVFIDKDCRDISWQILGICQNISGKRQAALYAFKRSATVPSIHKIRHATLSRVMDVMVQSRFFKKN
ncbi:uncharacterized protein LOC133193923 [Saccostrea echinata]|uniref:uncharacterized protein LOC133193923 n=1 Tax=Saccostrea echinata TaxID=191078 RepID=UPI002A834D59|nr:uncharacterized protein LOC133193923 [Saccostrea echinata]